LPNIDGYFYLQEAHSRYIGLGDYTGCINGDEFSRVENANGGSDTGGNRQIKIIIDASRSNSIYGNSTTVQPATCKAYFIIKY